LYLSFTVACLFYSICLVIFNPPSSSMLFELSSFNVYDFKTALFMVSGSYWMAQSLSPGHPMCACSVVPCMPYTSALKRMATDSTKMVVYVYQNTWYWPRRLKSWCSQLCGSCGLCGRITCSLSCCCTVLTDLLVNILAFHLVWSLVHSFSYNFCCFLVVVLFLRQCTWYLLWSFT